MSFTEDAPDRQTDKVRAWLDRLMFRPAQPGPEPELAPPVGGLDPISTQADPDIIATAIAYARRSDADPELRLLWARYAHSASDRLWGGTSRTALAASRLYQQVLTEQDLTVDAVHVARRRLAAHTYDPDSLLHQGSYALALHDDGQCDEAQEQITAALDHWSRRPHDCQDPGSLLLSGATIHAGCGRLTEAVTLLAQERVQLAVLTEHTRAAAGRLLSRAAANHHPRCASRTATRGAPSFEALSPGFWLAVLQPLPPASRPDDARQ
ncbi:hypothetical protein ACQP2X_39430 [Actinoplanes sp. CA-131856]